MKKFLSIIALMSAMPAFSATLNLSGTIASSCVLNSVTPASYSTLNIAAGQTVVVGQTNVSCNSGAGYKLRASSLNNGRLVNSSSPNNSTLYTMKIFGAGTLNHVSLTTTAADLVNTGALTAPVTNELRNVEVVVTPVPVAWAGTYSDTVTVTLTAL